MSEPLDIEAMVNNLRHESYAMALVIADHGKAKILSQQSRVEDSQKKIIDEVEILKKKLEIAVKCLTEIYSANCVRSDEVGYIAGLIGATLEKIELLDIEPEAKPKCVAHEWWQPANVTARHQWLCIHCKTDYDIVKIGATK